MTYNFEEILERTKTDPELFIADGDRAYDEQLNAAAARLKENINKSRVILLTGPSGSGKTTTAKKIAALLREIGVISYTIAMDNYYLSMDIDKMPLDEDGNIDYESPYCLDIPLLAEHFSALERGEEIIVPKFEFQTQMRNKERGIPLKLGPNDVAIFEGIHALSDLISSRNTSAQTIYVSANADITDSGGAVFAGNWTRLLRRITRDRQFRGAAPCFTMRIWESVRRGERLYIDPYKSKADIIINSALPYEVPVLKGFCNGIFKDLPEDIRNRDEFYRVGEALARFGDIDEALVKNDSLLREFIGGSSFSYSF